MLSLFSDKVESNPETLAIWVAPPPPEIPTFEEPFPPPLYPPIDDVAVPPT